MSPQPAEPTKCWPSERCGSYGPGHLMHWIHANRTGETPWGWRDATVVEVDDLWLAVHYVVEDHTVRIWHHEPLSDVLAVGSPVRLHEQYHALGGPFGWVNVAVFDGLGRVRAPEDRSLWAAEMHVAVTDLATGRALPMDHIVDAGDEDND